MGDYVKMRANYTPCLILPKGVHHLVHGGADCMETSRGLQINVLLSADHSHTGPAARVCTGDANVVAIAAIRNESDASLRVVLVHRLANVFLVLFSCNGQRQLIDVVNYLITKK